MKHLQKCERNRACELIYITRELICKPFTQGSFCAAPFTSKERK
nr:MAG TPA: hypothetical protein [Bacteriophage sp.]